MVALTRTYFLSNHDSQVQNRPTKEKSPVPRIKVLGMHCLALIRS